MEFTLDAIKEAHAKFTGVDFPRLVKEFKQMGMVKNEYILENGLSIYIDKGGERIEVPGNRSVITINESVNKEKAKKILKEHQAGKSDFITFCNEMAEAGIYKWITDIEAMTCNYLDRGGNLLISENIPVV